ncbi:hypothetical protein DV20_31150 [Amycolatopsis rifamycinica]|uniref:Uncharacterized protein n=1 Tax=Amycolatopsis rifamycinica TaxID=287986 RepID=A0A066U251_9PSEU|nr:hypothetical protein DV20_31150 [Amycolatopsis rifamycinica]
MTSSASGDGKPRTSPAATSTAGAAMPATNTQVGAVSGFAAGDHGVFFHGFATESQAWKASALTISEVPATCSHVPVAVSADACSAGESRKIPA